MYIIENLLFATKHENKWPWFTVKMRGSRNTFSILNARKITRVYLFNHKSSHHIRRFGVIHCLASDSSSLSPANLKKKIDVLITVVVRS